MQSDCFLFWEKKEKKAEFLLKLCDQALTLILAIEGYRTILAIKMQHWIGDDSKGNKIHTVNQYVHFLLGSILYKHVEDL